MNKANRKYLIHTLVAIVLMFVWIFVTVSLTGGREISDFTNTDMKIFAGFILCELLTLAFIVYCINKSQKTVSQNNANFHNAEKKTIDKRRIAISVASFIALFLTLLCGISAQNLFYSCSDDLIGLIAITTLLLPYLLLIINVIVNRIYVKKLNKKSMSENQQYWISHRDDAENTASKKLSLLKNLIRLNDFYSAFLAVCSFVSAFFCGVITEGGKSVSYLFALFIILSGATSRIRLKTHINYFEENKSYVYENDYPVLYELAKKASTAVGCSKKIKIAILDDFNAGATVINSTVSIQLGTLLLNSLSEDEVYCILLHEFYHVKDELKHKKINNYFRFLSDVHNNNISTIFLAITKDLFTFIDSYFNIQYNLYSYASSLTRECNADNAMLICGDKEIAASALVKLKYYELYEWEKGTYDTPCNFEAEEYNIHTLITDVQKFKSAIQPNIKKWNSLINNEILSRNATHPTLKMRIMSLGVSDVKALYPESSSQYVAECEKAIEYVSSLIAEQNKELYEEYRKFYYIESKDLVENWENNGKNISAQEYGDICNALRNLGRNTEALELCEKAIKNFDDTGSCYAYFVKGCFLLHSFDATGIDYIYKAIENNHNYINDGLSIIGHFCCLTGQEDQLEIYRQRALKLLDDNKIYAEAGVLSKKDKLSSESLPDGMLQDILTYITSENSENIDNIYLVRKIITDDFFSSTFVIKFASDTNDDIRYKILHRTFNYLDTCSDWQFSLFDYEDVKNVKVERITNSCVYSKQKTT